MGGAWDGGTTPTKTQRLSHHKTQTPTTHRMAYLHTHTHPTYTPTYLPAGGSRSPGAGPRARRGRWACMCGALAPWGPAPAACALWPPSSRRRRQRLCVCLWGGGTCVGHLTPLERTKKHPPTHTPAVALSPNGPTTTAAHSPGTDPLPKPARSASCPGVRPPLSLALPRALAPGPLAAAPSRSAAAAAHWPWRAARCSGVSPRRLGACVVVGLGGYDPSEKTKQDKGRRLWEPMTSCEGECVSVCRRRATDLERRDGGALLALHLRRHVLEDGLDRRGVPGLGRQVQGAVAEAVVCCCWW